MVDKIDIITPIEVDTLIDCILDSDCDVKNLILRLDKRVADLDFSVDLICDLIKEISEDSQIEDMNKIERAIDISIELISKRNGE